MRPAFKLAALNFEALAVLGLPIGGDAAVCVETRPEGAGGGAGGWRAAISRSVGGARYLARRESPREADGGVCYGCRQSSCALSSRCIEPRKRTITCIPASAASRAVLPTHQGIATALTPNACARLIKPTAARSVSIPPITAATACAAATSVTSAVEVNAPLMKIAEQTRHTSFDMLRIYNRRVDLFREHSGAGFL